MWSGTLTTKGGRLKTWYNLFSSIRTSTRV
jgi:hypothetical protein